MIFKTITNDLGNTKLSINNGLKYLFSGDLFKRNSVLSNSDINALKAYNIELKKVIGYEISNGQILPVTTSAQTAFNRTMQDASIEAQNMAASANGMTVNLEQIPKVSKAAAIGMRAFSIAGNMAFMFVATKLISSFINFIDNLHTTLKEQQEITQKLQGELSEIQSDISDVNSELQTTSDRIDELNKKDSLSFIEKEELENLTEQNKELERRNRLQITDIFTNLFTHKYRNRGIPASIPLFVYLLHYQWNFAKRINKMLTKRKIYNPTQARSRCNSTATVHNMRKYRM